MCCDVSVGVCVCWCVCVGGVRCGVCAESVWDVRFVLLVLWVCCAVSLCVVFGAGVGVQCVVSVAVCSWKTSCV